MTEREQIVAWLRVIAMSIGAERDKWPLWRHFLWALTHPLQFHTDYGRLFALSRAADAIERGDFLKDQSDG